MADQATFSDDAMPFMSALYAAAMRLTHIIECVASGLNESGADWKSLVAKGGLAARIEDGWAWVCLDGCERE